MLLQSRSITQSMLLVVGMILSSQAYAVDREYRLPDYRVHLSECLGVAAEIADRFTESTGFVVDRIRCEPVSFESAHLVLHYHAEVEPKLVTTDDSSTLLDAGIYHDRATCERSLAAELRQFQRHTGLTAVASYCRQDSARRFESPGKWFVRIDAFGVPEKSPWTSLFNRFSTPVTMSDQQWVSNLVAAMEELGHHVRVLTLRNELVSTQVSVRYYGEQRVRFSESSLIMSSSSLACQRQESLAEEIIAELGVANLMVYCGRNSRGTFELTMLNDESAGRINLSSIIALESFESERSCLRELSDLTLHYREQTGLDIIGGLCDFRGRRGGVEARLYYQE